MRLAVDSAAFQFTFGSDMAEDTIFALSSGALPSGVAIIRISGPACRDILGSMCGAVPEPNRAKLMSIRSRNDELLDDGLVLYFRAPRSFTGEDVAELQVHGGRATVKAILADLGSRPGLRLAEAGEFSLRAFGNGRIDLVGAEGLADLVAADTEMQRRLAAEHASGGLSSLYDSWTKRLLHARAMIEAEIDFADEDDVPGSVASSIWADMARLQTEISQHLEGSKVGAIIRDGLKVVIVGPPNSGKSSLINYLARRDIAIVTDVPGTTRDVLEVELDIAGFKVRVFDTAGLRQSGDVVEQEGIRRAMAAIESADLVLALCDVSQTGAESLFEFGDKPVIRVGTKIDRSAHTVQREPFDLLISTWTGDGLEMLVEGIKAWLPELESGHSLSLPSRERHVANLSDCALRLRASMIEDRGLDLRAEDLRSAARSLERITGKTDVEELLGVIFSQFCIGK